jgi:hypothetical protein
VGPGVRKLLADPHPAAGPALRDGLLALSMLEIENVPAPAETDGISNIYYLFAGSTTPRTAGASIAYQPVRWRENVIIRKSSQ